MKLKVSDLSNTRPLIIYEITMRVERLFNIDKSPTPLNDSVIYSNLFGNRMTLHMDIDKSGIDDSDLLKLLIEPIDDNFLHDMKLIVNNINRDFKYHDRQCRLNVTWYDSIPKSNNGDIGINLNTIE
jgi:hypothetical protein